MGTRCSWNTRRHSNLCQQTCMCCSPMITCPTSHSCARTHPSACELQPTLQPGPSVPCIHESWAREPAMALWSVAAPKDAATALQRPSTHIHTLKKGLVFFSSAMVDGTVGLWSLRCVMAHSNFLAMSSLVGSACVAYLARATIGEPNAPIIHDGISSVLQVVHCVLVSHMHQCFVRQRSQLLNQRIVHLLRRAAVEVAATYTPPVPPAPPAPPVPPARQRVATQPAWPAHARIHPYLRRTSCRP